MTNELKELQASNMALLNLLADIRAAVGDDGKRMQDELVQHLCELKEERDAQRTELLELRADYEATASRLKLAEAERDTLIAAAVDLTERAEKLASTINSLPPDLIQKLIAANPVPAPVTATPENPPYELGAEAAIKSLDYLIRQHEGNNAGCPAFVVKQICLQARAIIAAGRSETLDKVLQLCRSLQEQAERYQSGADTSLAKIKFECRALAMHDIQAMIAELIGQPAQPAAVPVDEQEPAAYLHRMEKSMELSFFGESAECTGRKDWIGFVPLFTRANTRSNAMLNAQPAAPPSSFAREERYLVVKISRLLPHQREEIVSAVKRELGHALVDCVVVEADWPEYEPTWQTIEARATGVAQP